MPNACLMASFLNFHGLEIYVVIISILDYQVLYQVLLGDVIRKFLCVLLLLDFLYESVFVQQTDSSSPSVSISPSLSFVPFLSLSLLCLSTSICNCLCLFHFILFHFKVGNSKDKDVCLSVYICRSMFISSYASFSVCLSSCISAIIVITLIIVG